MRLNDAVREGFRRIAAREPVTGPEADTLTTKALRGGPLLTQDDPARSAANVVSAAVGVVEGAAQAAAQAVTDGRDALQPTPQEARKYRSQTLATAAHAAKRVPGELKGTQRSVGRWLALAGVVQPPNRAEVRQIINDVVLLAQGNKLRHDVNSAHVARAPKLDDIAAMGQSLLGLNSGDDQIVEVRAVEFPSRRGKAFELHAFDRAGFHVLHCEVFMLEPGKLYVDDLRATHGRNAEDLMLSIGAERMPGRGNALAVAAGLEAVIVTGARAGIHQIVTRPGSPQVQRLYEKMGFTSPGSADPFKRRLVEWAVDRLPVVSGVIDAAKFATKSIRTMELIDRGEEADMRMVLDLTNAAAVEQALVGFRLGRAAIRDVPKGVADEVVRSGRAEPRPLAKAWARQYPEGAPNVRVLRLV